MSFEFSIHYKWPVRLDDGSVGGVLMAVETDVTVLVCEDMAAGDNTWCIDAVYLRGFRKRPDGWSTWMDHRLPSQDPQTKDIIRHVVEQYDQQIQEKWQRWLDDRAAREADAKREEMVS